ncbi:MAG: autotransporter outer membrane beta-barrel domain-containing protein [Phascolarctobacterium sp.]|uniref:autotransporter outer membrane beta-barrel domain-containing protein n=1 Tax=Phascolarctobacterium sp. TaxID=2049039 RepID=UPI0026DD6428|nr:autotransporter outer membrane beta-barrel domain-containing protein [Phascolarctobacterium sp.]MDO4921052.1 autotransporter outer membrane beta-barrel domain-containing protein [Phascolarctobacterium sp.]
MKRKQILAKAITLGLLLAMPCSAWAYDVVSSDTPLTENKTYTDGLNVNNSAALDGAGYDISVKGNTNDSGGNAYGVINYGKIENVVNFTAENLVLNSGSGAVISIQEGEFTGAFRNDEEATLKINGDTSFSGTTQVANYTYSSLYNANGAKIVIADGVTVTVANGFTNGYMKTPGGTLEAGQASFVIGKNGGFENNSGLAEVGSITGGDNNFVIVTTTNNAQLIVNNELKTSVYNTGELTYNGTASIGGSLQNTGTIYATKGFLKIDKDLTLSTANAAIWKNENKGLADIDVVGILTLDNNYYYGQSVLTANELVAGFIDNRGHIKADKIVAKEGFVSYYIENGESTIEVNELVIGNYVDDSGNSWASIIGEKDSGASGYGNSVVTVHKKLIFDSSNGMPIFENRDRLFLDSLDGEAIVIEGDGQLVNQVITSSYSGESVGIMAKNAEKETIENLIINSEFVNQGELYATNLAVLNGVDGIEQTDGTFKESRGFNVENLTVLSDGDFALKNTEYEFTSVGVGAGAALSTNADTVSVEKAIALDKSASFTANDVSASVISLADSSKFTAKDVSGTEAVALGAAAAFKSETLAMTEGGTVVSDGGSLSTTTMSGEELTFALQSGKEKQIAVQEFTGNDLKINVASLTPEQVVIDKMDGSGVTVTGDSQLTDTFEVDNVEAGLQALAYTASVNSTQNGQSKTVIAPAGKILGALYGETDGANHIITASVKEGVNNSNQGISEMASIALMTWRQENNDMNKRLGELRDSAGEHGVWVRMTRGESKYGNQNIKNQYNAYQLGYDEKLSSDKHWTVGAALTYTDAESSFRSGKGENKHKGLAVYGSRLNDDGSFIDLIARYARLEHEYEVYGGAGKGDFDTNGYSLSAEYGKRFTQKSGLWIEPQVELTYGRVSSGEYLTNNGVRVRQDGMDSLVGRLGFALGKNLAKNKGNVYLRASYLYDFDGETDVRYSYGRQNKRFEQDLGGGWWEVGVGTNINFSEAAHLYFDIEKTYGGDVATPWQWNAGVRWSF